MQLCAETYKMQAKHEKYKLVASLPKYTLELHKRAVGKLACTLPRVRE